MKFDAVSFLAPNVLVVAGSNISEDGEEEVYSGPHLAQ